MGGCAEIFMVGRFPFVARVKPLVSGFFVA